MVLKAILIGHCSVGVKTHTYVLGVHNCSVSVHKVITPPGGGGGGGVMVIRRKWVCDPGDEPLVETRLPSAPA